MDKIKLFYFEGNKEQEFEVGYKRPSLQLKAILTKLRSNYIANLDKLKVKYPQIKDLNITKPDITQINLTLDTVKIMDELLFLTDNYNMDYLKAILNTFGLPDEQKKLIDDKITSEFWQSQDLEMIGEAIISFRSIINI